MHREIPENLIESKLIEILSYGVTGTSEDYSSWIKLNFRLESNEEIQLDKNKVKSILENLKSKQIATEGKFDKSEYSSTKAIFDDPQLDKFIILGGAEFSPIQFVRSRQETFLISNNATEDEIMDISIGTIEAIENAVKYGDGKVVELIQQIDSDRNYKLNITNFIKEFDLDDEIERGKYSSSITLMRGIMIMEKLFNKLDLQIINESKQVHLYAEKKLA